MREGACEETDLARTNGAFWSAGVQLARNPILGRVIHIPRNQRSPDVGFSIVGRWAEANLPRRSAESTQITELLSVGVR